MKRNDLASSNIHRNPHPVSVRLLPDKAPELVQLGLQPLQDHRQGTYGWGDIEVLGGSTKLLAHELQEPAESNAYRTTDSAQRDALQEQSFNNGALLRGDQMIVWMQDKGPATPLAAVILLASVDMAISLEPRRSTLWTCLSRCHKALLSSPLDFRCELRVA